MSQPYMTIAEIEAQFPNEWVFIANPTYTQQQTVTGGIVVIHSADRADYYRQIAEWDDPAVLQTASWFAGNLDEHSLADVPALESGVA